MTQAIVTLAIGLCTVPGSYCHDKTESYYCDPSTLDNKCLAYLAKNNPTTAPDAERFYSKYKKCTSSYRESDKDTESCLWKKK